MNSITAYINVQERLLIGFPAMPNVVDSMIAAVKSSAKNSNPGFHTFSIEMLAGESGNIQVKHEGELEDGIELFVYAAANDDKLISTVLDAFGIEISKVSVSDVSGLAKENGNLYVMFNVEHDESEIDTASMTKIGEFLKSNPKAVSIQMSSNPQIAAEPIGSLLRRKSEANLQDYPETFDNGLFAIPTDIRKVFPMLTAPFRIPEIIKKVTLFLSGRSGSGKTTFAEKFAHYYNADYVFVNCVMITNPKNWVYTQTVREGENGASVTDYEYTELTKALMVKTDKPLVVLMDEANRLSTENANPLVSILGNQAILDLGVGKTYCFADNRPVVFIITANVGSKYAGTDLIDNAVWNRFDLKVSMTPLTADQMANLLIKTFEGHIEAVEARKVANLIAKVSDIVDEKGGAEISARQLLTLVKTYLLAGVNKQDAYNYVIVQHAPKALHATLLAEAKNSQFI